MKTVFLHGKLGKTFGYRWNLDVKSIPEAFHAIDCNKEGFLGHLLKETNNGIQYTVLKKDVKHIRDEKDAEDSVFEAIDKIDNNQKEIHVIAVPQGSEPIGLLIKAVAAFAAKSWVFKAILFAAISYGIQMLMKPPKPPEVKNDNVSTKSYILNGPTNRLSQGIPVPIGYGRLMIGSSSIGVEKTSKSLPSDRKSNAADALESYDLFQYLDLLCEGPIEGFVDEFGNLVDSDNLGRAVYLNDVQIKNRQGQYNYILTEDEDQEVDYTKGTDNENKILAKNGVTAIREYNLILNGPAPYLKNYGGVSNTTRYDSVAYREDTVYTASPTPNVDDIISFAVNEGGAKIVSHLVSNINVKEINIGFRTEMFHNRIADRGTENARSVTEGNHCDFAIMVERKGVEYNVLDPDSGCVVTIPKSFSFNSQNNKGVTKENGEVLSKAAFGRKFYNESTQKSLYNFLPVNTGEIDKYINNPDSSNESRVINDSYENFVDRNPEIYRAYNRHVTNNQFFKIRGVATSPFSFFMKIEFVLDSLTTERNHGITFKVIKLSAEFDPTVDKEGYGVSGLYNNRNLQFSYVQERVPEKLLYPHTSTALIKFDSRNFSSVPDRKYHVKLKKVLVPQNYNPKTRKYTGPWNGLFSGQQDANQQLYTIPDSEKVWSDNPAWIFFDIISDPRFGVAKYGITEDEIDKWQLYRIAKYCDELVETGYEIETKTKLGRAFSTENKLMTNMNGEDGAFEIQIEDYFWTSGGGSNILKIDKDFENKNYLPSGINSRSALLNSSIINLVYQDMLGREATSSEISFYSNKNLKVENLIADLLNEDELQPRVFTKQDFIKEFGDGDEFKGKKVAFFLGKNALNSSSPVSKESIQKKSSARAGYINIEERIIVSADPASRRVVVSGPTFEDVPSTVDGKTFGACASQINYPIVEPRFTSNIYITDKTEAISVLNAICSVFRGVITYYGGRISAMQDAPKNPIHLFNNSNVSPAGFSYSGSERNKKFTSSVVRFNNKEKNFMPDLVFEEDVKAIQRLGFLENETIGFGITSPSQARRLARWILLTSQVENDVISFTASLEANSLAPGLIFEVSDEMRIGSSRGGRITDIIQKKKYKSNNIEIEIEDPFFILDKPFADRPVFGRMQISISCGTSQESLDNVNFRSSFELNEDDQDVEIESIHTSQLKIFEGYVSKKSYENSYKTCIGNLLLKIPIEVDVASNSFKSYYHGFGNGDRVRFISSGVLPAGLEKSKIFDDSYYVVNSSKHTFQVSLENNGAYIFIGDVGKDKLLNEGGVHYVCPDTVDGSVNEMTLKAIDQVSKGSVYALSGVSNLTNDGIVNYSQQELEKIGVTSAVSASHGDHFESLYFGSLYLTKSKNWLYAVNLGWLNVDIILKNSSKPTPQFYWTDVGWCSILTSNPRYLFIYDFAKREGINQWVYTDRNSLGNIYRIYVYDDNASSKKKGDIFVFGEDKKTIIEEKSPDGYWVIFSDEEENDSSSSPGAKQNNTDPINSINDTPGYVEAEISSVSLIEAKDSIQGANSILVTLPETHPLNLIANPQINIYGLIHSSGANSSFQSIINSSWGAIYRSQHSIELVNSSQAYDALVSDGGSISDFGAIYEIQVEKALETSIFETKMYRTISCKEVGKNEYEIIGTEYNYEKFEASDKNLSVKIPSVPIPPQADMSIPDSPSDLELEDLTYRP